MTALSRTSRQPTDLMHRRVHLDLNATYLWHKVPLRIQTNSPTILQAATDAGLTPLKDRHARSHLCWELTIEEDASASGPACAPRAWRTRHSIFIEIAQRQWFAFDATSGDGTGFLAAPEPAFAARAYVEAILKVLEPDLQHRFGAAGCND
jgi:hypothetical protein